MTDHQPATRERLLSPEKIRGFRLFSDQETLAEFHVPSLAFSGAAIRMLLGHVDALTEQIEANPSPQAVQRRNEDWEAACVVLDRAASVFDRAASVTELSDEADGELRAAIERLDEALGAKIHRRPQGSASPQAVRELVEAAREHRFECCRAYDGFKRLDAALKAFPPAPSPGESE